MGGALGVGDIVEVKGEGGPLGRMGRVVELRLLGRLVVVELPDGERISLSSRHVTRVAMGRPPDHPT